MDTSIEALKNSARNVTSAVGAVTSAAAGMNKYPRSDSAKSWWNQKVEELWRREDELYKLMTARREDRANDHE